MSEEVSASKEESVNDGVEAVVADETDNSISSTNEIQSENSSDSSETPEISSNQILEFSSFTRRGTKYPGKRFSIPFIRAIPFPLDTEKWAAPATLSRRWR